MRITNEILGVGGLISEGSQSGCLYPLFPKSDKHLISPRSFTPESNIKVSRKKKMVTN